MAYSQVWFPYLHIAGALGYVAGPIILGVVLKRCVRASNPLQQLDKSLQPVCLLVGMIAVTVSISNLLHVWVHVTWRLLLACALLPVSGFLIGAVVNAIFRQKLSQLKSVAVVSSIQNTLLASVILQTSYPAEDASLMGVTVACVEAMTLALMLLAYIVHVIVWLSCPQYRRSHDSVGISGLHCSIGERLVKNMVKAGEIRFCNRDNRSPPDTTSSSNSSKTSACCSENHSIIDTMASKERNILTTRASSFTQRTLGSVNKAFSSSFDSLGRTSQVLTAPAGPSSNMGPTSAELTLNYFVSPDAFTPTPQKEEGKDKDSLSIDYDMLSNLGKENKPLQPPRADEVTTEMTAEHPPSTPDCDDNVGLIQ